MFDKFIITYDENGNFTSLAHPMVGVKCSQVHLSP